MIRREVRRCGRAPGDLTPEEQAGIDAFRSAASGCRTRRPGTVRSPV